MKKIILFITLVSTLSAVSQNTEFKTIAINTVNIIEMTLLVDQFDFYYYINNNVLYKIKGATSVEYKILTWKITKVDIKTL
jgi:spore coat protein CotH